jgi:DNA-binding CsgD family transcriptional regulator/PAS domain-containing protein
MQRPLSLEEFSGLLGSLYQGPLESIPWSTFLDQLKCSMRAKHATLTLRPPSQHVDGLSINTAGSSAAMSASYNQYFYTLDPFTDLPNRQVVICTEFVSEKDWLESEFYKGFLEPVDVFHILGADINTSLGSKCRIRISRDRASGPFNQQDKVFLASFLPHLERTVILHMYLNRIESERNLYAGAVDKLAVGTIILDQDGKVLQSNRLAQRLLAERDGIELVNDGLQVGTVRNCQEFHKLIDQALLSQKGKNPSLVKAMRVQRPSGRVNLGLIVRRVQQSEWSDGRYCPAVVIFISDPAQKSSALEEIVRSLFDLTPAETHLTFQLANGQTIDEASEELGISRNTARAQLRSIFSKTGVTSQTLLVRLILRSVATLG